MKERYKIIYEDEHFIVVNKPPKFLTLPDRYALHIPNLYNSLQKIYENIYVVHRLDRETSGLICFARTEEAHKLLNDKFVNRAVKKFYWVLVDGHLPQPEGTVDKPIAAGQGKSIRMRVAQNGKPSRTDYKVIETFRQYSLVEAQIHTGRTHQIRVHFKYIGHPLVVDELYGKSDAFYVSKIKRKYKKNNFEEEQPIMSRSTLHSRRLEFEHPITGKPMVFEADLPKDFRAVLNQLRKWNAVI